MEYNLFLASKFIFKQVLYVDALAMLHHDMGGGFDDSSMVKPLVNFRIDCKKTIDCSFPINCLSTAKHLNYQSTINVTLNNRIFGIN